MRSYASVEDVALLWRPLTAEERRRAEALLPIVSDLLRQAARNAGRDLDRMLLDSRALASAARAVTVDVAARVLRQSTQGEPVTQESQTALGYSWSGTYAVPGGGISNAIMNSDLRRLGLLRQTVGVIELYDTGRDGASAGPDADGYGLL